MNDNIPNDFGKLDAQSVESKQAQFTPEEMSLWQSLRELEETEARHNKIVYEPAS